MILWSRNSLNISRKQEKQKQNLTAWALLTYWILHFPAAPAVLPNVAGKSYSPILNKPLPTLTLLSKPSPLASTPVTWEAVNVETICCLYCMFLCTSRYLGNHYLEIRLRPISPRCFWEHRSVFYVCRRLVF